MSKALHALDDLLESVINVIHFGFWLAVAGGVFLGLSYLAQRK